MLVVTKVRKLCIYLLVLPFILPGCEIYPQKPVAPLTVDNVAVTFNSRILYDLGIPGSDEINDPQKFYKDVIDNRLISEIVPLGMSAERFRKLRQSHVLWMANQDDVTRANISLSYQAILKNLVLSGRQPHYTKTFRGCEDSGDYASEITVLNNLFMVDPDSNRSILLPETSNENKLCPVRAVPDLIQIWIKQCHGGSALTNSYSPPDGLNSNCQAQNIRVYFCALPFMNKHSPYAAIRCPFLVQRDTTFILAGNLNNSGNPFSDQNTPRHTLLPHIKLIRSEDSEGQIKDERTLVRSLTWLYEKCVIEDHGVVFDLENIPNACLRPLSSGFRELHLTEDAQFYKEQRWRWHVEDDGHRLSENFYPNLVVKRIRIFREVATATGVPRRHYLRATEISKLVVGEGVSERRCNPLAEQGTGIAYFDPESSCRGWLLDVTPAYDYSDITKVINWDLYFRINSENGHIPEEPFTYVNGEPLKIEFLVGRRSRLQ